MPRTPRRRSIRQQPPRAGRRAALGQNFLRDYRVAARIAGLLDDDPGRPVLELGAGDGALTAALRRRRREVTAVELDPRWVRALEHRFGPAVRVVHGDMLRIAPPDGVHDIVSSVPFAITTAFLRALLPRRTWATAVLLVQWEVARKRAGVAGGTLLTASWWPWYEARLAGRVAAGAFRPRPAVDGGVLVLRRRARPLVAEAERRAYQRTVRAVFTAPGDDLARILRAHAPRRTVRAWARDADVSAHARPRDLDPAQWVALHQALREQRR